MSLFEESVKNASTTLEYWSKLIAFLQGAEGPSGEKFNQEAEVPGTGHELWWFDERTIATCNLIKSLEKPELDAGAPVPLVYIDQLEQASQQFKDTILEAAGSAEQTENKGIASLNPGNWVVVVNETNENLNFASYLQNIKSYAEALLTKFYQVAPIVGAGKFDAFAEAIREISEKTESVRKNNDAASKAKDSAESDASATNSLKNQAEKDRSEVSSLLGGAKETLANIEAVNQSCQSELEHVAEISDRAGSLKSQVDGYETQFQAFKQSLDDRNAAFKKWSDNVESLYGGLEENKAQISDVIKRAEEMLKGATNAGLASTFNATLFELDGKLKWAQGIFYVSVFLLFLSAVPLAWYMIYATLLVGDVESVQAGGAVEDATAQFGLSLNGRRLSLSTTIALFLLMVPTVWLTKFSAARHHQIFQLKEHYQYKYSLAMAVDGFKKQAPDHADAIAAETFNRLLFNPADRIEGKGASDDHPSPLMNWLMNKFGFNAKGRE